VTSLGLVAAVLVLLAGAAPFARLLATRPFRRKLVSFPRIATAIAVLGVGGIAAVGVAAMRAPAVLLGAAVVVACALGAAAWRARPAFGRKRGLPPGSLGLLPVGPIVDDRFFLRQAARYGPVFKTSQYARPMACVVGLERIVDVLRRYDDVLDPPALPFDAFVPGGFVRSMRGERHAATAARLRPLAAREAVAAHEAFVVKAAHAALDGLATTCAGEHAVSPRPALRALLFTVLIRVLFGIEPDDPLVPRLRALYDVIDVRRPSGALRRHAGPALDELITLMRPRGGRGEGLLAAIARQDSEAATDPSIVANLVYVVQNARDDTAGLLLWALKMLGDHPEWARALATAPDAEALALRIVLETLRLEQSEFLFRKARAPLAIDGFVVPAGCLVRFCIRESHRDPALFPDPDRFDPDRFLTMPGRLAYSPFGASTSRHACLGEQITKTIASVTLAELARHFTWRVVSDGPREFDGWHWTTNENFRITIAHRTDRGTAPERIRC
jgi:cytochrome P450